MKDKNQVPIVAGSRVKTTNGKIAGLVRAKPSDNNALWIWSGFGWIAPLSAFAESELTLCY